MSDLQAALAPEFPRPSRRAHPTRADRVDGRSSGSSAFRPYVVVPLKSAIIKRKLRALSVCIEEPPSCHFRHQSSLRTLAQGALRHPRQGGGAARSKKFDPAVYVTMRLRPDMLAFARQVQTACDHAKNAAARLADVEPPPFEDNETTLDELKARIQRRSTFSPRSTRRRSTPAPTREIVFPVGAAARRRCSAPTISRISRCRTSISISTTAYDILRYAGVADRQARLPRRRSRRRPRSEHSAAKGIP